jgi:hypothetical protein
MADSGNIENQMKRYNLLKKTYSILLTLTVVLGISTIIYLLTPIEWIKHTNSLNYMLSVIGSTSTLMIIQILIMAISLPFTWITIYLNISRPIIPLKYILKSYTIIMAILIIGYIFIPSTSNLSNIVNPVITHTIQNNK